MSLLVPDTGLLFWMTLSFGIVFFILAKYAFPIITQSVEKRNSYINESLEAARKAEEQLATLSQQAEAMMEKARYEQKKLIEEAMETKKRIEAEARETAEAETRILMKKATEEIEIAKKRALGEIKDQLVDLSVKIAEKVVNEELSNDKKQKALIERLLQEEMIYKS
ncbi:F0F1 ATP synthase subunit B [Parabacteroides sp. PF5-9]|uniref:F0F1 ATP synthase subunit B n=1 Tax=Parabacteroides sp. PF5-9 TaxID=1742404 RepID=UPI002476BA32|nr:F0F1 ATP synthase subunit B [Parabacteroides sp. PF5-9]MDH6358015.1 F-type H+-transporting ATPase subunit b [Parabacteroides sp. PF5-9]